MLRLLPPSALLGLALLTSSLQALATVYSAAVSNKPGRLSELMLDAFAIELEQQLDVELSVMPLPFARRLRNLEMGELDISAGLLKTAEREESIYFMEPAYIDGFSHHFILRTEEPRELERYEDLYRFVIGVNNDARYFERFDKDKMLHKQNIAASTTCAQMLYRKRVDVCIERRFNDPRLQASAHRSPAFKTAGYSHSTTRPAYFVLSRNSPLFERRTELESLLAQMKSQGRFTEVIRRYNQQMLE
ncbi:substrate-binding periplasmic protein [Aliagarivorans marinus]|uniref:substrate-binding periplasmic protein n=1 Tax=Aliagarivorans marinus TaxID=561965 RepID=UPI000478CC2E|nr:transporter substrate-binding domain-containing protein [Aliagarivorans marinus]